MTDAPAPPPSTPSPEPPEPQATSTWTSPSPATPQRSGDGVAPELALGAILVVAGIILLVAQLADVDVWSLGWPFIIVAVGVGILVFGLVSANDSGMVVGGTVTTSVGLVLAFQNATGLWATWAYAWALVGPAASGLGLLIYGLRAGDRSDIRNGTWGLLGGLGLFAVGFLFFEGIIGLSGFDFTIAEWVLPALVIGIGVVILGRALVQRGGPDTTSP
jgi:hypothetical protein